MSSYFSNITELQRRFTTHPSIGCAPTRSMLQLRLRNRGDFTEAFTADRLTRVFGFDRVFQNVQICKSKGETLGEIDTLVLFGDRAIVLQAKSKKLTLGARKGNDRLLQVDFKGRRFRTLLIRHSRALTYLAILLSLCVLRTVEPSHSLGARRLFSLYRSSPTTIQRWHSNLASSCKQSLPSESPLRSL